MSEQQDGVEIKGKFYPWADQMRLVDPILVREVTGLSYQEFLSAWQEMAGEIADADEGEVEVDPSVLSGMIAVAVWQQHPDWSRVKARQFIERLSFDDVKILGSEDEPDGEADPQMGVAGDSSGSNISSTTPSESNAQQDDRSELANRIVTGPGRSAVSSLA